MYAFGIDPHLFAQTKSPIVFVKRCLFCLLNMIAILTLAACDEHAPLVQGPFPSAKEVRLFVSKPYDGGNKVTYSKREGLALKADERAEFESTLRVEPMPQDMAACFVPHHFFRYYDADGKQIGEIEVCFCCEGVRASENSKIAVKPDQILTADYGKLKKLVQRLGESTEVNC
jgi:hypothetical protein